MIKKYLPNFLKKNPVLHFLVILWRDREVREGFLYFLKPLNKKKSIKIILEELSCISRYWNCPPYHYFTYRLFNKKLSKEQLLDIIPPIFYTNVYWDKRNKELNKSLFQSKNFQNELFQKYKIASMKVIATVKNNWLLNSEDKPITIDELIRNHIVSDDSGLVIKPDNGRGGEGIHFITRKNKTIYLGNKPISQHNILKSLEKNRNYIIQERFLQSKEMAAINASSVNTLRIYTQIKGDKAVLPACVLRIGVNKVVDNFCQGGLMVPVDVETGMLAEFALTKNGDTKFYSHPVSKYVFKDTKLAHWQEIKDQVTKYAMLLSDCRDLGWDVAIGEKGIKVIEINIQHGLFVQNVIGGMRKILGVYPES